MACVVLTFSLLWLLAQASDPVENKYFHLIKKDFGEKAQRLAQAPWADIPYREKYASNRQDIIDDIFDTGEIKLSTLLSLLALLVSSVALLAAALAPAWQLFLRTFTTNTNSSNTLNPTITGTTIPVLPTNTLTGRRRRSTQAGLVVSIFSYSPDKSSGPFIIMHFQQKLGDVQKMQSVVSALDEAIEVYHKLGTDCPESVMCDVINETSRSFSPVTKNLALLFR